MIRDIDIRHAKLSIRPVAGKQGLPILVLEFPNGCVSLPLTPSQQGRIRKLNKTAEVAEKSQYQGEM